MLKDFLKYTLVYIPILIISCSKNNDAPIIFKGVAAKTIRPVSCTVFVYQVEIDSEQGKEWIGTIELPEEFRKPDLEIILDLAEYDQSELGCIALSPIEFYYARNVRLINK
tara:strand:+ start:17166 stop:17498 length:333 start_codon:yes stop_codon:yes gene_type:complete